MAVCDNCGSPLKAGMLGTNQPLTAAQVDLLNYSFGTRWSAGCWKCGGDKVDQAKAKLWQAGPVLAEKLRVGLDVIPLLSIQCPQDWRYQPLDLVTAQSTTGTGIFSDVASAFTDLLGSQSRTYNAKIRAGEDLCRAALRLQCLDAGGSAVIGVDVDYAEVGGQRAMLMVCMTGTIVHVQNPDIVSAEFPALLDSLREARREQVKVHAFAGI